MRVFAMATTALMVSISACGGKQSAEFGDRDALALCQFAFKKVSRDPDKAEIPAVQNFGKGDESYFAWGSETRVMRMRNGLGLDVAATGSCIVSKSAKKITSLTLNGESII